MRPLHLAIGKFNIDIIVKLSKIPDIDSKSTTDILDILPGGSATNYSIATTRLGHSAKLLAKVGKSPIVSALMRPLAEEGVGLDFVTEYDIKPNMAIIFLRDDGSVSIVRKTNQNLLPTLEDVKKFSNMFDVFHFASVSPEIIYADPAAKLISYDPGPYASEYEGEKVDILYVNKKEYETLRSKVNAKLTVIKMGKDGAMVKGDEECYSSGVNVNVIDTTGAGDVFDAAFNVSVLNSNNIEDSLKFAIVSSALKVTRIGGIGSPKLEEVVKKLKEVNINIRCK
ncbi:PfkB family carbohydrate kinase [Acidianus manzaensis]|uniref:Sugar kinase n=1 Tax=Acidianus manzaensis TaxID=282676 RepID=A0A1W6JXV9_9CREN|nr:PfkB family carbohydrate kinase [Acidianus manzaensis]ARM75082.1 sugar kinase [Acidianus manzaensis]